VPRPVFPAVAAGEEDSNDDDEVVVEVEGEEVSSITSVGMENARVRTGGDGCCEGDAEPRRDEEAAGGE
jgi:hypothetical protein